MPEVRADYVDVYAFRRVARDVEFLLLKRRPEAYLGDTWHAVHGKIEPGETAVAAALRELREETGLRPARFWQLDTPHIFYMARTDQVIVAACFAAEIAADAVVTLNHEHTAHQWVAADRMEAMLMWPGNRRLHFAAGVGGRAASARGAVAAPGASMRRRSGRHTARSAARRIDTPYISADSALNKSGATALTIAPRGCKMRAVAYRHSPAGAYTK